MSETRPKIRLFVESELANGQTVQLAGPQAHYLRSVMRLGPGDAIAVFNGVDGEWRATVDDLRKSGGSLCIADQLRPQTEEPDVWLLFAPVKRAAVDFLVQKATELGVSRLVPVVTRRTVVERANVDRLRAVAIEAAEQSHRLSVPEIATPLPLDRVIDEWPAQRPLIFCDEAGGPPLAAVLRDRADSFHAPAILIGPEGGFDEMERKWLGELPFSTAVSLGPRILRAETAALAALAIWQGLIAG